METLPVINFIKSNFTHKRSALIPLLQQFDWDNSKLKDIYSLFLNNLKRPMSIRVGMSDEKINKLKESKIDTEELGDISDFYTIVLNPEIEKVDDWDFEDIIKQNKEVRYCRIWINWFLPLYYIETNYEKGLDDGKFVQYGPLKILTEFELQLIEKIKTILSNHNYSPCSLDFLTQIIPDLTTDLVDEDVTIFDCLFSDLNYYWKEHIRKNNGSIKDLYDGNLTIGIREYLDDNFVLIKKERTLYYNSFGNVTIITNNDQKVTEVICRGYIDGIAGNERRIKIGK